MYIYVLTVYVHGYVCVCEFYEYQKLIRGHPLRSYNEWPGENEGSIGDEVGAKKEERGRKTQKILNKNDYNKKQNDFSFRQNYACISLSHIKKLGKDKWTN